MIKIKNSIYQLLLLTILLVGCSTYNKVLNKGTAEEKYTLANHLFDKQDYLKSIRLYDMVLPSYATKPQKEIIIYKLAEANFKIKDYTTAIYNYEKFINNFSKSSKLEDANFFKAESYYHLSPKFSIDQADTFKAIEAFQNFIDNNPDSGKLEVANKRIKELTLKLEKKAFQIAKQYYNIGHYEAAMVAFDNMILDYLGTSYKEEAMLYKFKSAYEIALHSVVYKKSERINEALRCFDRYQKAFPSAKMLEDATKLKNNLVKEQQQTKV